MKRIQTLCGVVGFMLIVTSGVSVSTQSSGREWYVAPTGSATGTGSITSPLSLTRALSSTSPAQPGDTVWLRGGTYTGAYTSELTGTASAPITVRGYRGERATLDANNAAARSAGVMLAINGAHVVFRDFEVTSSDAGRTDQNTGFGNGPTGINVNQSQDIKLVNLVIHDLVGQGIGAWTENTDAEINGCLIYYNGMSDHDHGIYVQNRFGRKRIADNIIFNQASHGIHGYASSDGFINSITIEGNTVFENGALVNQSSRNILLGGDRVAQNPVVRSNYTYLTGSLSDSNIGYSAGTTNAIVQDNYWIAGGAAMQFNLNGGATVSGNFFTGPLDPADAPARWPSNTYLSSRPTIGQAVFVRPNEYETGRANITIYNWSTAASVAVDLAGAGLTVGDSFEVRDAQNFFGAPVATGTYVGSPITIPMMGPEPVAPVGIDLLPPVHTAPGFGAFVLLKTSSGSEEPTPPPLADPGPPSTPPPVSPDATADIPSGVSLPPVVTTAPTLPMSSCSIPDPFVTLGGGICRDGGWLPPGYPIPTGVVAVIPAVPVMPATPASGCALSDPFVSLGGGVCVSGGWLPPGYPIPAGVVPVVPAAAPVMPAPPAPASGCALSDPFVSMGGGVCVSGGWVPRGHRLAGGGA